MYMYVCTCNTVYVHKSYAITSLIQTDQESILSDTSLSSQTVKQISQEMEEREEKEKSTAVSVEQQLLSQLITNVLLILRHTSDEREANFVTSTTTKGFTRNNVTI